MVAPLIASFDWSKLNVENLKVLDLACGSGINGFWFAQQGSQVHFVDKDLSRLIYPKSDYPHCTFSDWDMETVPAKTLAVESYDIILVFHYLHRPLFDQIKRALKPGGLLFYQTFTTQQANIGRPKNPSFLLKPNELKQTFSCWHAITYTEGLIENSADQSQSYKAQLVSQKLS